MHAVQLMRKNPKIERQPRILITLRFAVQPIHNDAFLASQYIHPFDMQAFKRFVGYLLALAHVTI